MWGEDLRHLNVSRRPCVARNRAYIGMRVTRAFTRHAEQLKTKTTCKGMGPRLPAQR